MSADGRDKIYSKMLSSQLRNKAQEFLASRRNANNLADILQLYEVETDNYTSVLLATEVIFVEVLQRGDLRHISDQYPDNPEVIYRQWLTECYQTAWNAILTACNRGKVASRVQALVTAVKLLAAEGRWPINDTDGFYFPINKLQEIFNTLLHPENSTLAQIQRFQEFTEYCDVTQFGLKVLSMMGYRKSATSTYILNYMELLDRLAADVPHDKQAQPNRKDTEESLKVLCSSDGNNFTFNAQQCRRYTNRCWNQACQWSLCSDTRVHKRALLLLVERMMPLLNKPQLSTDLLMDSLDSGGAISMLALQGILELVRRHNINYPDIYDRLYCMFEPEMFATRFKQRLIHLADIFLSSTHLPEGLVAAFAKRLSRLALIAPPEDAARLMQLVANLLHRHPGLKRMICYEDAPTIMSADPYIMEESTPGASQALGSSLWEVAALQKHWQPGVSSAAARVLAAIDTNPNQPPTHINITEDQALFDMELKKKFKSIEMNFIRPKSMSQTSGERLLQYWDLIG